jgi:hypothetical protein
MKLWLVAICSVYHSVTGPDGGSVARLRRRVGPCVEAAGGTRRSDAARNIRVAPSTGSTVDERSVYACRAREFLVVECYGSENAYRNQIERHGKESDSKGGGDRLVETFA